MKGTELHLDRSLGSKQCGRNTARLLFIWLCYFQRSPCSFQAAQRPAVFSIAFLDNVL